MKTCPFCAEQIQDAAIKCKHCGEMLGVISPSRHLSRPASSAPSPPPASLVQTPGPAAADAPVTRFIVGPAPRKPLDPEAAKRAANLLRGPCPHCSTVLEIAQGFKFLECSSCHRKSEIDMARETFTAIDYQGNPTHLNISPAYMVPVFLALLGVNGVGALWTAGPTQSLFGAGFGFGAIFLIPVVLHYVVAWSRGTPVSNSVGSVAAIGAIVPGISLSVVMIPSKSTAAAPTTATSGGFGIEHFFILLILLGVGCWLTDRLNAALEGGELGASLGLTGLLLGGLVGYLLRPSYGAFGQLPFGIVITRGASTQGLDELVKPAAAASFNYLLAGMVVGAILGVVSGRLSRRTIDPGP